MLDPKQLLATPTYSVSQYWKRITTPTDTIQKPPSPLLLLGRDAVITNEYWQIIHSQAKNIKWTTE